jgi:uncharacterized protein
VPLMWAIFTRQGGAHGAWHYLRLERPLKSTAIGIGVGFLVLAGVFILGLVLERTDVPTENPQLEAMGSIMTLPLALAVSLAAAFGEEILFRGVLQRWLGVWGQAVVFGLAHASYGTPLQIILPFVLGVVFGYLVKRGFRLWVPIAAHFTLDFVVLMALMAQGPPA